MNELLLRLSEAVEQIISPPMFAVPGADSDLYLDLQAIRLEGANQCCADLLKLIHAEQGSAAAASVRSHMEPLRLRLAGKFPLSTELLDPARWPDVGLQ